MVFEQGWQKGRKYSFFPGRQKILGINGISAPQCVFELDDFFLKHTIFIPLKTGIPPL